MDFITNLMGIIGGDNVFWTYLILFVVSFLDTLIVIGAFFPASIFVMAAGFFATHTNINIWLAFLIIVSGGLLGDLLSYFFGRKGTNWFKGEKKILKTFYIDKGQMFFNKYGDNGIIFGRFLGVIKSIIPFIAGVIKMDLKKFIFLNILSGIIWTIVHLGIGFFLGKSLDIFFVSKKLKFIIIFLPFILFLLLTIFEFRIKIFKGKNENKT